MTALLDRARGGLPAGAHPRRAGGAHAARAGGGDPRLPPRPRGRPRRDAGHGRRAGGAAAEPQRCAWRPWTRRKPPPMVAELPELRALAGFRNLPRGDLAALARAVAAISRLAGAPVQDAEINPLIVRPEGQGVVAVDGLVVLARHAGEQGGTRHGHARRQRRAPDAPGPGGEVRRPRADAAGTGDPGARGVRWQVLADRGGGGAAARAVRRSWACWRWTCPRRSAAPTCRPPR